MRYSAVRRDILAIFVIFVASGLSAQSYGEFFSPVYKLISTGVNVSVAVVDVNRPTTPLAKIEREFLNRFRKYENFFLIDRASIDSILQEQELAISGIYDEKQLPEIGNLMGCNYMCLHDDGSLRFVEVRSGRVISVFQPKPKVSRKRINIVIPSPHIERELVLSPGIGFGTGMYTIVYPGGIDEEYSSATLFSLGVGTHIYSWFIIQALVGYCIDMVYYYDPNSGTYHDGNPYTSSSRNGGGLLLGARTLSEIKPNVFLEVDLGYLQTSAVYQGYYVGIGIGFYNWSLVISPTLAGLTASLYYSIVLK